MVCKGRWCLICPQAVGKRYSVNSSTRECPRQGRRGIGLRLAGIEHRAMSADTTPPISNRSIATPSPSSVVLSPLGSAVCPVRVLLCVGMLRQKAFQLLPSCLHLQEAGVAKVFSASVVCVCVCVCSTPW